MKPQNDLLRVIVRKSMPKQTKKVNVQKAKIYTSASRPKACKSTQPNELRRFISVKSLKAGRISKPTL